MRGKAGGGEKSLTGGGEVERKPQRQRSKASFAKTPRGGSAPRMGVVQVLAGAGGMWRVQAVADVIASGAGGTSVK